jgi:hypothetical protein
MRPDTEVLFVEDDAGDRELVERALRRVARPGRWAIVGSVAEAKDYLDREECPSATNHVCRSGRRDEA